MQQLLFVIFDNSQLDRLEVPVQLLMEIGRPFLTGCDQKKRDKAKHVSPKVAFSSRAHRDWCKIAYLRRSKQRISIGYFRPQE